MIDPIVLSGLPSPELNLSMESIASKPTTDFGAMIGHGVHALNSQLVTADTALRAYAAGDGPTTADLMVTMTEARERLQFAVEVRNRIVDAYQNLTNMQI
jgi:flagellar hook-basal body complex protein FliE